MSYSNSGGGTLTLPSPTHVHHVDVTSAVRSLRRSLSRSPSKFRLVPKKSPSPSPKSPLSPTPKSPPKRSSAQHSIFAGFQSNPPYTPSPLAVPFPPSAKLALRSGSRAKATPTRSSSRTRTSPRSPMKRVLSNNSDTGNIPPASLSASGGGQENSRGSSPTERTVERKSFERLSKMPFGSDSAPVNYALSRLGGDGANDPHTQSSTSSPLKRSDAIMNLDQASLGSPVAKRRSLHGSGFGQDFNVFDHGPSSTSHFEILEDTTPDPVYELSTASIISDNSSTFVPRRSSSLRKSTLQQRHGEKTSWGRRHAAQLLAAQQAQAAAAANKQQQDTPEVSTPSKERMNRPRLSMDQFVAPMPRDSPFNSQGSLPNASMHMLSQVPHQPHPLSRTMTTSSSSSSIPDESPTHAPPHFGEQPRPKLDFSKSLPAGSLRPFAIDAESGLSEFATPQNYKSVKPLPAAFASTGLISKVNRHPEQPQMTRGISKANVPDTPCKKHVNAAFATYPAAMPGSALVKARNLRHSFGTPSTPFNFHGNPPAAGTFGKPAGVFGSSFGNNGLTRRGSFLSIDGYESGGSPDSKDDSQTSADFPPPTPTKQALAQQQQNNQSPSHNRSSAGSQSAVGYGFTKKLPRTSSKLNLSTSHGDQGDDSDESMDMNDSPTTAHGRVLRSSDTLSLLSNSRTHRNLNLQAPLLPKSLTAPLSSTCTKRGFAKFSHVAPASPLERIDFIERLSPRTPRDNGVVPPDPSGLSISNPRDAPASKAAGLSMSMPPPATPTTGREYFPAMGDRRQSTTPVSTYAPPEIDQSLTSRFDKVEMIGTGEFSSVYKVTKTTPLNISAFFSLNASNSSSQGRTTTTPTSQQVYAVKKSRQPIAGTRDRQRKLQEVNVLKALGQSDHVVHLIDSWEDKYLYIQTEYCEEGSLDIFLSQVGRKGRLDDFRIWKIMLELSMGLRHIHNSGYIHLDLKPANIFITFEGSLKIGDFGMAAAWPAQAGIEGEGDREYIGPEILLGKYDKPADVFALGLIMLEIAGNVQLPDNGPTWQRLRSGDISDVPSLTWSSESALQRDATGIPLEDADINMDTFGSDDELEAGLGSPTMSSRKRNCVGSTRSLSHDPGNLFGSSRRGELHRAPSFMTDSYHECALEKLVRWMISPDPNDRPMIHQILEAESVNWVSSRRRAAATVYEGNWGPADELLGDDAEMLDV